MAEPAGKVFKFIWIALQFLMHGDNRPLHGLPVLIKGNIGTRDRMQTDGDRSPIFVCASYELCWLTSSI